MLKGQVPLIFGAKKRDNVVWIRTSDSPRFKTKRAVFLGRGRFTAAFYHKESEVYLYTFYGDNSKNVLTGLTNVNNPHIPKVYSAGTINYRGYELQVYKTRYYLTNPTKLIMGQKNWDIMKELQRVHKEADEKIKGNIITNNDVHRYNQYVYENAKVPDRMKSALETIALNCEPWGDHYLFDDFRRQNIGLDNRDNLVFVDPVFDAERVYNSLTKKLHRSKKARRQAIADIDTLMS